MTSLLAPHSAVTAGVNCAAASRRGIDGNAARPSAPLRGRMSSAEFVFENSVKPTRRMSSSVTSPDSLNGRLRLSSSSSQSRPSTSAAAGSTRNVFMATSSSSSSSTESVSHSPSIPCAACSGEGWLLCEVCQGQRVNVKVNKRLFRRCPGCSAVGMLLCQKCKVYKCVTFPYGVDSGAVDG
ncbi:hypothetical protein CLOM_g4245 [Closterium sp. NIES-68]|nr:hypothetical protein CLOM_g4245 [Closterium sp. NIES-68]GJP69267.1 hypothetical protein CLOP_g211 [Closterium sp. NIES-67]